MNNDDAEPEITQIPIDFSFITPFKNVDQIIVLQPAQQDLLPPHNEDSYEIQTLFKKGQPGLESEMKVIAPEVQPTPSVAPEESVIKRSKSKKRREHISRLVKSREGEDGGETDEENRKLTNLKQLLKYDKEDTKEFLLEYEHKMKQQSDDHNFYAMDLEKILTLKMEYEKKLHHHHHHKPDPKKKKKTKTDWTHVKFHTDKYDDFSYQFPTKQYCENFCKENREQIFFLLPRNVIIEFGPYTVMGILDYRTCRLQGISRLLRKKGAEVILKAGCHLNRVNVWHLENIIFSCDINKLGYGGDGELDPLAIAGAKAFDRSAKKAFKILKGRYTFDDNDKQCKEADEKVRLNFTLI